MLPLRKLQEDFCAAVFDKTQTTDKLLQNIEENGLSVAGRLQIYRNNIVITLIEALKNAYPNVLRLVGEDFFAATAREYMTAMPSTSGNLDYFGDQFATFLKSFPPASALTYLAEMAQFEWAYHLAYHADDAPALILSRLATIAEDDYAHIQFIFHPGCQLLSFKHPIFSIWQFCESEANDDAQSLILTGEGDRIIIARRQYNLYVSTLSVGEYSLLLALQQGQLFTDACAQAVTLDAELPIDEIIQKHCLQGTITDLIIRK